MGHWMGYGMDWWMWGLMILGILSLWALVVVVIRGVFPGEPTHTLSPPPASSDPLRLLDERLARGEVDAEQYRRTRNVLTGAN